jgi:hypothetical protein
MQKACSLAEQTLAASTIPVTITPVAAKEISGNINEQLYAINKKLRS